MWWVYTLLCSALGIVLGVILFVAFYYTRSAKALPRNFKQLGAELRWQFYGLRALGEDFIMRPKNQVEIFDQTGRVAVITGGNRGIGLRVVEKLLQCNISVIMGIRNPEEAQKSVEALIDKTTTKGTVFYEHVDMSSMQSVRNFAAILQTKYPKIDILINNAAIMASPFELTEDGFESQFAINYLGHFLLTHLILPQLIASGTENCNSRIVNVSSCVHLVGNINFDDIHGQKYYYPSEAYGHSKLAQVLFTRHVQTIMTKAQLPVQSYAVHPGLVDTDLFCHASTSDVPLLKKAMFKSPEQGSRTIVYAAISPKLEGKGGSYLSNCNLSKMHSAAKDPEFCEKLFQFTCEMLEIEEFGKI